MTKIRTFLLLSLAFISLASFTSKDSTSGAGISFEHSFKAALEKASDENKNIFFDAYAAWCGPCKAMAKNTFTNEKVAEYFNDNFVNVKVDMEKGEGRELKQKYPLNAYPTLFIVAPDGKIVATSVGYLNPDQLLAFGKQNVRNKK